MRPVLVLTHAPHEGPGRIGPALDMPYRVRTVLDDPDAALPPVDAIGGLVVMGGPMDADDDAGHPGLVAERRLLAAAVDADVPVLGVCLGMQLLALALGARLLRRAGTEIGFAPVDVVADDPLFDAFGSRPAVLHWHRDAVSLPPTAMLLASTETTPVQAFRVGSALGLQFHAELDRRMLDLWLATPEMTDGLDTDDIETIRDDASRHLPSLTRASDAVFAAFGARVRSRG